MRRNLLGRMFAAVLVLGLGLSACDADEGDVDDADPGAIVQEAVASDEATAGSDDAAATEDEPADPGSNGSLADPDEIVALPDDFPDSVPLHAGPIVRATGVRMGEGKGFWELHVRVHDADAAMQVVRADVVAAGFPEDSWDEVGASIIANFANEDMQVSVQSGTRKGVGLLLYTVMEL